MTDNNFQVRRVNNATGDIPVDEQIVCSKADKLRWETEARIDELNMLEQYAEFVSPDRIDMVGMHNILDRIAELQSQLTKGKV